MQFLRYPDIRLFRLIFGQLAHNHFGFVDNQILIFSFISINDAKIHDVNIIDELKTEPGSIYVLVSIMKKKLKLEKSLSTILQILSWNLFGKIPNSWSFTDAAYRNKFDSGAM